jgi:hypothetical protein
MRTFRTIRPLAAAALSLAAGAAGLALVAAPSASGEEPTYVAEVRQTWDGDSDSGDLPECGPRNINGRGNGNRAGWVVESTIPPFTDVEIGDEWIVHASVSSLTANGGNDGPDPVNLVFPVYGPVTAFAPPDPTDWSGEVLHGGSGFVGPVAPIGDWGYEFDMNSDPKGLSAGDGVDANLAIHLKATAPGEVGVRRLDVYGYDGTYKPGSFSCELITGWYWNVVPPPAPPTSGTDSGSTDARYGLVGFDDRNGGEHGIDIDVLANDDDPNTPSGPGNTSEVKIKAWGEAANGTVDCGNEALNGTESFVNMATGPCTYIPDLDFAGIDSFNYRLRSVSGLEKVVPVKVVVEANRAPTIPGILNYAMTTGQTIVNAPTGVTDPDGDELACSAGSVLPDGVTIDADTCRFDYDPPDDSSPIEFTLRACDVHPLLTQQSFPSNVTAHPGYHLSPDDAPDDLSSTVSRRCRDRAVEITVVDDDQFLFAEPVGFSDVSVVDAGYGDGTGPFQIRIPVVENDIDYGNNAFPAEIGGLFLTNVPAGEEFDPAWGTATVDGRDIVFQPADGLEGWIEFSYRICDTGDPDQPNVITALCGYGTVSIFVVPNAAPIATDDEAVTASEVDVVVDVGANDTEPDGEDLVCIPGALVVEPAGLISSATIDSDCAVIVNPADGATGVATMPYTVCDQHQLSQPGFADDPYQPSDPSVLPDSIVSRCDTGLLTVTIGETEVEGEVVDNDPDPTCTADAIVTTAGTSVEIPVLANDTDVDALGDASPLLVTGVGTIEAEDVSDQGGALTTTDTTVRYTPPAGFVGLDTFGYGAIDTADQGCDAEVRVTVLPASGTGGVDGDGTGRGALPRTGSEAMALVPLALGLTLMGIGFQIMGRARPRRTS